jgi:hypothetical protein
VKIFNTLQELWDYCLICPICQNSSRRILISVGPDLVVSLNHFRKQDSSLFLQCSFNKKNNYYIIEYNIDCNTNLYDVTVTNRHINAPHHQMTDQKVMQAYFYFYIQSSCDKCVASATYSADLELLQDEKRVFNIELEREHFVLADDMTHRLTVLYDRDVMLASNDAHQKSVELPILNLDFSDQPKLINKIKTLILFS